MHMAASDTCSANMQKQTDQSFMATILYQTYQILSIGFAKIKNEVSNFNCLSLLYTKIMNTIVYIEKSVGITNSCD